MIFKLRNAFRCIFMMVCLATSSGFADEPLSGDQWQNPFRSTQEESDSSLDSLTLAGVLDLVADANPSLKAGLKQIEAAEGLLTQAGLWSNPELEIEMEEVGWDAPGIQESEITVTLSQEVELWGNRRNRRELSQRELEVILLEAQIAAFDIYAITVERYAALSHAQRRVTLAQEAVDLAVDITESARIRVDMGAAMQSELFLGQLELETAELDLAEAVSELDISRTEIASLWKGEASKIVVAQTDFDPTVIGRVDALSLLLERSREVRTLDAKTALTDAELNLERSGAKPNLTLNGGYKRFEVDGSNSFVIGVGFPLPFLNRNQGSIRSLEANREALRFSREQALTAAKAEFETSSGRIEQQISRYRKIRTQVLPKAEETYFSLKNAYDKGKLPYTTLLEAQRMLLDLRFELNDIRLTVKQEIVTLERLLGVTFQ